MIFDEKPVAALGITLHVQYIINREVSARPRVPKLSLAMYPFSISIH